MSATVSSSPGTVGGGVSRKTGSLHRERRWALISAYVFLVIFAVLFLAPPVYMLVTSFKGSAEVANLQGSPWMIRDPTLENYAAILGDPSRPDSGSLTSG